MKDGQMGASIDELVYATRELGERAEADLGAGLGSSPFRSQLTTIEAYIPGRSASDAAELILGTQKAFALACTLSDVFEAESLALALSSDRLGPERLRPWELWIDELHTSSIRSKLSVVGDGARLEFLQKPIATASAFLAVVTLLVGGTATVLEHQRGEPAQEGRSCTLAYEADNQADYRLLLQSLIRLPDGCTITIKLHGHGSTIEGTSGPDRRGQE